MNTVLLAMVWLVGAAQAAPSELVQQGRLIDSTGAPINGTTDLVFRLYDGQPGAPAVWSETHEGVVLSGGYYAVTLGALQPLDPAWQQATSVTVEVMGREGPAQVIGRAPDPRHSLSCADGELLRGSAEQGWSCGRARTYLGTLDLPMTFSGTPSSAYSQINPGYGFGYSFNDYVGYLSQGQVLNQRLCASYTDSGSGNGQLQLRFTKYESGTLRWSTSFPTTASGSTRAQTRCTSWDTVGALANCTYSWTNTCVVGLRHSQNTHVVLFNLWWEFSAI